MPSTIVLITGADSGVGFATAKVLACASEDFHVIMASRSLEKAESAKSEIEAAGTKGLLSTVQLDVTDETSIEQAVALIRQKFGCLDVLINNAAVSCVDPDVKTRFQLSLDTNVTGPAMVSAAFRPLLFESQKPYSIYVSSVMGSIAMASDPTSMLYRIDYPNADAYGASKAALNMVALQESIKFSSTALKVFALCPGFVRSNIRGQSEEARSGGGKAGDPQVCGETILSVIRGERDADAGKFVHEGGVSP